jgi:hypothetical protein
MSNRESAEFPETRSNAVCATSEPQNLYIINKSRGVERNKIDKSSKVDLLNVANLLNLSDFTIKNSMEIPNTTNPVLLIVANTIIEVAPINNTFCIKENLLLSNKNTITAINATEALLGSLNVPVNRKIVSESVTAITFPLMVQSDLTSK